MLLKFGHFVLDEGRFELRRSGTKVPLRRRALEVLLYLARHRQRVVSKEELVSEVWEGRFLSDSSVAQCVRALRRALGDDSKAPSVVATVYGRGYRFVADVVDAEPPEAAAAAGGSPPGESEMTPGLPVRQIFVGRSRQLRQLGWALSAALEGRGRLVLLEGERGCGKTHLAEHFAHRANRLGVRVLRGRFEGNEGTELFEPWRQLLRSLVALEAQEGTEEPRPAPLKDRSGTSRHDESSVAEQLAAALCRRVQEQPALLLLDDLDAATVESLEPLRCLASRLDSLPLLVVGTCCRPRRAGRAGALGGLDRLLDFLVGRQVVEILPVLPFHQQEVEEFLRQALEEVPADGVAEQVLEQTDGNPLFVAEVVRLWLCQRSTRYEVASEKLTTPPKLRATFGRRFRRLSRECQGLLEVASVVGRCFEISVSERAAGLAASRGLSLVQEAVDAGMVLPAPSPLGLDCSGLYQWCHVLFRDYVYGRLGVDRRAELHRRVGEALEALHAGTAAESAGLLAHHFFQSPDPEAQEKALGFSMSAGDAALSRLEYRSAAFHYRRAAVVLERQGGGGSKLHCHLLVLLARAQIWSCDSAEGRATLARAIELARQLGSWRLLARAAVLPYSMGFLGLIDREWLRMMEEVAAGIPAEDERLSVAVLNCWVVASHLLEDPEELRLQHARSVAMAERLGDDEGLVAAYVVQHALLTPPYAGDERRALVRRAVLLSERTDSRLMKLLARAESLQNAVEFVDSEAAEREMKAIEQLAGDESHAVSTLCRGLYDQLQGRLECAEEALSRVFDCVEGPVAPRAWVSPLFVAQLFGLRRDQGRLEELEPLLSSVLERAPGAHLWRALLALVQLANDRRGEAQIELERLTQSGLSDLPKTSSWVGTACLVGELCAGLGDQKSAARLSALLQPFRDQMALVGYFCVGPVARSVGLLAAARGLYDEALECLERAASKVSALRARPSLVRIWLDMAAVLRSRLLPGDFQRSQELLEEAVAEATALGMGGWSVSWRHPLEGQFADIPTRPVREERRSSSHHADDPGERRRRSKVSS